AVAQILRILRRCFSEIWKTYYCPARLCRISAAPCALGACTKKSWQEDKENPTGARRCFDASQPGKRRRCSRRQKHALAYRWQRSTPKTLPYRFHHYCLVVAQGLDDARDVSGECADILSAT